MPILLHCFLLGWVVAVLWSTSVCWLMLTATKAAENHLNETLPSPTSEPAAASRAVVWSASAQGLLQVVLCSGHRHDNKSVPTRTGGGAHNAHVVCGCQSSVVTWVGLIRTQLISLELSIDDNTNRRTLHYWQTVVIILTWKIK